jgi:hypothetical protein
MRPWCGDALSDVQFDSSRPASGDRVRRLLVGDNLPLHRAQAERRGDRAN